MRKLVIFGTDAFGELSHYYFTTDSSYSVAAFTVDGAYVRETSYKGLPVVPFEDVQVAFPPDEHDMFVAVGIRDLNKFRAGKVEAAEAKGYRLASYLHSSAVAPRNISLAPNTMVMEDVVIHPFVHIGRNTIIWPASQITIRSHVGDHCWLVAVTLGESVVIGDYSFLGIRAAIASSVKIGRSNIIGIGAMVRHDTADGAVFRAEGTERSRVPSHRAARFLQ